MWHDDHINGVFLYTSCTRTGKAGSEHRVDDVEPADVAVAVRFLNLTRRDIGPRRAAAPELSEISPDGRGGFGVWPDGHGGFGVWPDGHGGFGVWPDGHGGFGVRTPRM